jgi:hypothetical protein
MSVKIAVKTQGIRQRIIETGFSEGGKLNGCFLRVYCIAPPPTLASWSLAGLYSQADAENNKLLCNHLADIMAEYDLKHAYAPSVAASSAAVVESRELSTLIKLQNDISIYRNKYVPSDGISLKWGENFMMSGGGCPVIVLTGLNKKGEMICIAAHASRESLIDRKFLLGEEPRTNESVVYALAKNAYLQGCLLSKTTLRIFFQIRSDGFAHELDHETHGEYNKKLVEYVSSHDPQACVIRENVAYLDIKKLITAQAKRAGIGTVEGTHELPYEDVFPHTRHPMRTLRDKRSLVIVERVW